MPIYPTTYTPTNLMSHDDEPSWKIDRYPFTDAGAITLASMKPGYLVKFDANRTHVLGAVALDDAVLDAVIVDLPNPDEPTVGGSVAVALAGSFDQNTVKYADGTTPISVAGVTRLRDMGVFLEPTTPTGPFSP